MQPDAGRTASRSGAVPFGQTARGVCALRYFREVRRFRGRDAQPCVDRGMSPGGYVAFVLVRATRCAVRRCPRGDTLHLRAAVFSGCAAIPGMRCGACSSAPAARGRNGSREGEKLLSDLSRGGHGLGTVRQSGGGDGACPTVFGRRPWKTFARSAAPEGHFSAAGRPGLQDVGKGVFPERLF